MGRQMIAGEPVEELLKALRQLTWRKTGTGKIRLSASLDGELGGPLCRALIRIERELLQNGEAVSRPGVHVRTPEQRRADAVVALAEDALQETLLAAWRGLGAFERRASVRTWLYSVATSRALNMLRAAKRRPQVELPLPDVSLPEPTRLAEPLWLEPYPDVLIENELESPPGPEARYETKEAISLAFVTALQLLPARQRAVLILRDVLGFRASEVARMLDSSVESVTSALKRARATLESRPHAEPPPQPDSPTERQLVGRLAAAFEASDVDAIVALLADDVRLSMPPLPLEDIGRDDAARFYAVVAARPGRRRIIQTRANGQPALAFYSRDATGDVFRATSLLVVTPGVSPRSPDSTRACSTISGSRGSCPSEPARSAGAGDAMASRRCRGSRPPRRRRR
ncbi:MAG: RNA polymerase subunit sigma-70 [Actinomycetota bacterium]